jgi:hypothetical protein
MIELLNYLPGCMHGAELLQKVQCMHVRTVSQHLYASCLAACMLLALFSFHSGSGDLMSQLLAQQHACMLLIRDCKSNSSSPPSSVDLLF